MNKPLFHIVDPGMLTHYGHHKEINMAIAIGMKERGYNVQLWVNRAYELSPSEELMEGIEVIPYFSINPYALFKSKYYAEIINQYNFAAHSFSKEIKTLNLSGIIHVPNLFSCFFLGLSELKNTLITACVHHHPDRYSTYGEILWTQSWIQTKNKLRNLRLFVVEEQMINEIDRCVDASNGVLLAPFPITEIKQLPPKVFNKYIGILGGMRPEQGISYLNVTTSIIKSLGYEVVLQDIRNNFSKRAIAKNVKLVGYSEKFTDIFSSCEAVLLNYDPIAYRFMGSGIMWEAAANGVPVFYTRGTAMSTVARKYDFDLSFSYSNYESIKNVLECYIKNHTSIHAKSTVAAKNLRLTHGISNYISYLI